jgi:hypothetical protein
MKIYELKKWDVVTWLRINDIAKDCIYQWMDWGFAKLTSENLDWFINIWSQEEVEWQDWIYRII